MKLDGKDHEILRILRRDSRRTIREISKETGIRPSTVHQRIRRLIGLRVIRSFTLDVDPKALGESLAVFMLISSNQVLHPHSFDKDCIKEAYSVTGEFEIIMKLGFRDIAEFNDFVVEFRKDFDLKRVMTMVVTSEIKK